MMETKLKKKNNDMFEITTMNMSCSCSARCVSCSCVATESTENDRYDTTADSNYREYYRKLVEVRDLTTAGIM